MCKKIVIGRFGKTYGIKGWLQIISFTDPKEKILTYKPWYIRQNQTWQEIIPENSAQHAQKIVVKLSKIETPQDARSYTNLDIAIDHEQLPELPADEYYWTDLEGLTVIDTNGNKLGIVDHLMATGANDVFVVTDANKQQHLIPYLDQVIVKINLEQKTILVEWEVL
ncbi:MAG: ribosome maturation factor RimM [Gammaproteobacteria bacterium]|nr:ribosome maturation factor RimM [Gammaproteobacteria bacterium]